MATAVYKHSSGLQTGLRVDSAKARPSDVVTAVYMHSPHPAEAAQHGCPCFPEAETCMEAAHTLPLCTSGTQACVSHARRLLQAGQC